MLSRVAESLYWMSRYIERAENAARFLAANDYVSLDFPEGVDLWQPLVEATGDKSEFDARYSAATPENVAAFLSRDRSNPNSIVSSVEAARENARSVRDFLTLEMWERLNYLYLQIQSGQQSGTLPLKEVIRSCQLILGITDATMSRGEGWEFCRIGRMLERADKTSRILDVRFLLSVPKNGEAARPYDDILWAALLKSISALEMYRKSHRLIVPGRVVDFLMLDPEFPRSIHHCLVEAEEAVHAISGTPSRQFVNRAEQLLGRLRAEFDYLNVEEIVETGVHDFVDSLQIKLNDASAAITDTFFTLHIPHAPTYIEQ